MIGPFFGGNGDSGSEDVTFFDSIDLVLFPVDS